MSCKSSCSNECRPCAIRGPIGLPGPRGPVNNNALFTFNSGLLVNMATVLALIQNNLNVDVVYNAALTAFSTTPILNAAYTGGVNSAFSNTVTLINSLPGASFSNVANNLLSYLTTNELVQATAYPLSATAILTATQAALASVFNSIAPLGSDAENIPAIQSSFVLGTGYIKPPAFASATAVVVPYDTKLVRLEVSGDLHSTGSSTASLSNEVFNFQIEVEAPPDNIGTNSTTTLTTYNVLSSSAQLVFAIGGASASASYNASNSVGFATPIPVTAGTKLTVIVTRPYGNSATDFAALQATIVTSQT
jgi:hypothetical protein